MFGYRSILPEPPRPVVIRESRRAPWFVGVGLGIFVPANNTMIMRRIADSTASLAGGLVSMARGIGTTLASR